MKKLTMMIVFGLVLMLTACSYSMDGGYYSNVTPSIGNIIGEDTETYQEIIENAFISTEDETTSQLSLTANTASYTNFRSMVNNDRTIDRDSLRVEEFINYFNYDYDNPTGEDILSTHVEIFDTPWHADTKLMMIGMKAAMVESTYTGNNFVFLVDVSGSMGSDNKLGLVRRSLNILVENLDNEDTISLVTYSSQTNTVFTGLTGSDRNTITNYINQLYASGSTNGSDGIERAYSIATDYFIQGGNNRIILCTDGDFNFGIVDRGELEEFIIQKRESGIYFSIYGFGYGNLQDDNLETLARSGNGTYAYIDSDMEANKAFSLEGLEGSLYTVARDVKAQITFNADNISEFRLIGYEHGLLTEEEFENTETDAGEIGSDLMVTIVFEIKLSENFSGEALADLVIRYKNPDTSDDTQLEQISSITTLQMTDAPSEDAQFVTSLIETVLMLRDSAYKGTGSLATAKARIEGLQSVIDDVYKTEFVALLSAVITQELTTE